MDPEAYRKKIEQEILEIIEDKLKNGSMEASRAQQIAKFVLEKLHPPLTLEEIRKIVPTLDDDFAELSAASMHVVMENDDEIRKIAVEHAQRLINSGKFEEAKATMDEAINTTNN